MNIFFFSSLLQTSLPSVFLNSKMKESTKYWIWFKVTKVIVILQANLLGHFYLSRPWYVYFSNSKMFRYWNANVKYCLWNYLCNAIWIPQLLVWLIYGSHMHRSMHTFVVLYLRFHLSLILSHLFWKVTWEHAIINM